VKVPQEEKDQEHFRHLRHRAVDLPKVVPTHRPLERIRVQLVRRGVVVPAPTKRIVNPGAPDRSYLKGEIFVILSGSVSLGVLRLLWSPVVAYAFSSS
jgi:hypothetical protein